MTRRAEPSAAPAREVQGAGEGGLERKGERDDRVVHFSVPSEHNTQSIKPLAEFAKMIVNYLKTAENFWKTKNRASAVKDG